MNLQVYQTGRDGRSAETGNAGHLHMPETQLPDLQQKVLNCLFARLGDLEFNKIQIMPKHIAQFVGSSVAHVPHENTGTVDRTRSTATLLLDLDNGSTTEDRAGTPRGCAEQRAAVAAAKECWVGSRLCAAVAPQGPRGEPAQPRYVTEQMTQDGFPFKEFRLRNSCSVTKALP